MTARISECGFAWVVCGRKLLIWQYRQPQAATVPPPTGGTPQRRQAVLNQCYELQLPQSDLAHRAELVSVFQSASSHTPSCIAVSPEGKCLCCILNMSFNILIRFFRCGPLLAGCRSLRRLGRAERGLARPRMR